MWMVVSVEIKQYAQHCEHKPENDAAQKNEQEECVCVFVCVCVVYVLVKIINQRWSIAKPYQTNTRNF